jgi:general secretion pathway protein D
MLAGLIRDEERTIAAGLPGLSDLPLIGKLFATTRREAHESDVILTLTPHIVRVLDLTESDLRPFRLGRDAGATPGPELPAALPRDRELEPINPAPAEPAPTFPQPLQPSPPGTNPLKGGTLPGSVSPILPPAPPTPPKKGGGS